LDLNPSFLAK